MSNISIHRVKGDDAIIVSTDTHHMALDSRAINDRGWSNGTDHLDDDDFELIGKLYPFEVGDIVHDGADLPNGSIVMSEDDRPRKRIDIRKWYGLEAGLSYNGPGDNATIIRLGYGK